MTPCSGARRELSGLREKTAVVRAGLEAFVARVDVHLIAAAVASRETLWTKDRRLADAANRLGVADV
jgi:hypothetical protein